MTNRELLNTLLEETLQEDGENGFLVQHLRAQLKSMDRFEPLEKAYQQFLIGAGPWPPEHRPDLPENPQENYREDMYGNRAMSPEEMAEAEEEEKRQQEEG